MGLKEIRHQVAKLWWRSVVGTIERVPERNQIREFNCHSTAHEWERSGGGAPPIKASGEVQEESAFSFAPTQQRADNAGNKIPSLSEVARDVLGPNSTAAISNVLVFGNGGSAPLKRMQIRLGDPKEVPATINLLAAALQRSGVDFRAVRNPSIPATEIWLTSQLHDGKKTLLSSAAMVSVQAARQVAANAGSPRAQPQ